MSTPDELRAQAQALLERATQIETPMTEAEVKALYAEGRYAEIVQAKQDGRLTDYLNTTTEGETA